MGEPRPHPDRPARIKPMTLLLGLFAVAAALYPQLCEPYRPWNFAAFGAIGLFVAARVGLLPGLLLMFGAKLAGDFLNYEHHGLDPRYLPSPVIYLCFAFYPLAGWRLLRRTESPLRIAGVAVLGGLPFFLITNGLCWLNPNAGYDPGPLGLLQSYAAGLPFHRGTVIGDVAFTGLLFGLHAALSRAYFPAERVALQPEAVR
jgi:hypothetical protein